MIEERLAKLEGIVEGFRSFPPLALTALSIVMAAMGVVLTIGIFSINGMRGEIKDLGTRTDSQIKDLGTRTDSQIKDLGTRTDSQIKELGARTDNQIRELGTRMDGQIRELGARMDGLSKQLSEEFRAMRAETAAQTSAIANSITAARQFQPQVIVAPPAPEPQQDQNPRR